MMEICFVSVRILLHFELDHAVVAYVVGTKTCAVLAEEATEIRQTDLWGKANQILWGKGRHKGCEYLGAVDGWQRLAITAQLI